MHRLKRHRRLGSLIHFDYPSQVALAQSQVQTPLLQAKNLCRHRYSDQYYPQQQRFPETAANHLKTAHSDKRPRSLALCQQKIWQQWWETHM